jgi:hypothetical protein
MILICSFAVPSYGFYWINITAVTVLFQQAQWILRIDIALFRGLANCDHFSGSDIGVVLIAHRYHIPSFSLES